MQYEQQAGSGDRQVTPESKALAAEWLKRIDSACSKDDETRFSDNRKWLRGVDPTSGKKLRTNLHFANLAAMRPQVYAKDPEFSVTPTKAVAEDQIPTWQGFGATAEAVLDEFLVKRAKIKKRAKRLLTSAYTNAVGWWKVCWQEDRRADPLIQNQLKDTQDNLQRLQRQRDELDDHEARSEIELKVAELQQTLAGLQAQPEVVVSRSTTVDFVLPEDVRILDDTVLEIGDYERADAITHRVWFTRAKFRERFGFDPKAAKTYAKQGAPARPDGDRKADRDADLLAVWEVWHQAAGRVITVCEGVEGCVREPYSPDWTGERWFPFFALTFNDVDGGGLYPPSDVELTLEVVSSYNQSRDDFARDRKKAMPLNVVRKGGSLTPDDVQRIVNRTGEEGALVVEGPGGRPLSDDIFSGQLAQVRPENYDTSADRQDMEMLLGGGDAARGSVLTAKTATEAEILAQGMRGRSAERTDTIEDLLSDVGKYVLEMCLRKLTPQEVKRVAGPDAIWPELRESRDVFEMVSLRVRGGSTGKPDRLQEQDRWTKLLPVIKEAMGQVAELRAAGQGAMAQAVVELVRETLRRFDERLDVDQYLPQPKDGAQDGEGDAGQEPPISPEMLLQAQQMVQALQQRIAELEQALADQARQERVAVEKARAEAAARVEVARIVAPIEAAARVEVARIEKASAAQVAALDEIGDMAEATASADPQGLGALAAPGLQDDLGNAAAPGGMPGVES